MPMNQIVTPAKAGVPGQDGAGDDAALNLAEIPASAGMTRVRQRVRQAGITAAVVVGGLLALDLIGLVATVYFGPELIEAAKSAGVADLLSR